MFVYKVDRSAPDRAPIDLAFLLKFPWLNCSRSTVERDTAFKHRPDRVGFIAVQLHKAAGRVHPQRLVLPQNPANRVNVHEFAANADYFCLHCFLPFVGLLVCACVLPLRDCRSATGATPGHSTTTGKVVWDGRCTGRTLATGSLSPAPASCL